MKKINFTIVAILIASLSFTLSSCKKYEEGPKFSLLTKKMHLTGQWDLKEDINDNGTTYEDTSSDYFEIKKDGTYDVVISGSTTLTGTWEFHQHKSTLVTKHTSNNTNYSEEIYIIRLTNKELWLRDNAGDIAKYEKK